MNSPGLPSLAMAIPVALLSASAALSSESQESRPAAAGKPRGSKFDLALAGVVDTRLWPEEAAALELRPYRMLLDKVRTGPDEIAMRFAIIRARLVAAELLRSPDEFRGMLTDVPMATVVELRRADAPGVGRFDYCEVHAGIVGRFQRNPDTGYGRIELWAFRALRLPGEAMLYPGDKVNLSGYFFKNVPVVDARSAVHWMPLLVCPWPTFVQWLPLTPQLQAAEMAHLLPTSEYPHGEVRRRLVLDVREDGRLALGGAPVTRTSALAEIRRYAFAHPGRVMIARLPKLDGEGALEGIVRALKEAAGLGRVLVKDLPAPAAR